MKKQKLIIKMIIALTVFIISIQSVNANENRLNELSLKFNYLLNIDRTNQIFLLNLVSYIFSICNEYFFSISFLFCLRVCVNKPFSKVKASTK